MIPSRVFTVYCRVCNVFCCTIAGKQRYGEIEFTGTFFINEQDDNVGHYIGFVFAYQNNRQFYLVSWRQDNRNYLTTTYKAGIASVQIKVNFYLFLFMRYKHWTQHNSNSPGGIRNVTESGNRNGMHNIDSLKLWIFCTFTGENNCRECIV